ncbi:hypothetical protein D3C77_597590 [compost metagenome]
MPQTRSKNDLLMIVRSEPVFRPYRQWLERALEGQFSDTAEACNLWKELVRDFRKPNNPNTSTPRWMVGAFALSLILLACALYLTLQF